MMATLDTRTLRQFAVFVCVGGGSAVLDVSTMQVLLLFGGGYPASVTLGFLIGLFANYIGHACFTFRTSFERRELVKFLGVVAANYLITMLFVYISEVLLGSVLVGKILSLPVVAANGYFLSRVWVFKKDDLQGY